MDDIRKMVLGQGWLTLTSFTTGQPFQYFSWGINMRHTLKSCGRRGAFKAFEDMSAPRWNAEPVTFIKAVGMGHE